MTMRRNPRRSRRRIDPADMWEPLDGPLHVKHSHAGQKPAPAPLLDGYRMATEAENEAARAQLREGNRRAQEAIERRGGFASLRERVMAKTSRARAYLAGEPSQDPKSPESRDIANRSAGDCEG
jgi:hypothetical protein